MQSATPHTQIWRPASLLASGLLLVLLVALFVVGTRTEPPASLVLEALFWALLATLFLGARRLSGTVAAFAMARWLSESWATFARSYRTLFFGALSLAAFMATLFELIVGVKVTRLLSAWLG